jgi:predicted DCC family thiol-disulfide oxidoreductase YuxK
MKTMTVLYDAGCGFCVRCKDWLARQPAYVPLELVPARSPEARERFPTLDVGPEDELIVVDDEGGVYLDTAAWLMCLYALEDYREWSLWLADPARLPFARRVFGWLSRNRAGLSSLLAAAPRQEVMALVLEAPEPPRCAVPVAPAAPSPAPVTKARAT